METVRDIKYKKAKLTVNGVRRLVEYSVICAADTPAVIWFSTDTMNRLLFSEIVQRTELERAVAVHEGIKFLWM